MKMEYAIKILENEKENLQWWVTMLERSPDRDADVDTAIKERKRKLQDIHEAIEKLSQ